MSGVIQSIEIHYYITQLNSARWVGGTCTLQERALVDNYGNIFDYPSLAKSISDAGKRYQLIQTLKLNLIVRLVKLPDADLPRSQSCYTIIISCLDKL